MLKNKKPQNNFDILWKIHIFFIVFTIYIEKQHAFCNNQGMRSQSG
jgi:hypothetical protein